MTEAAGLLPIVIDYAHLECGGWCYYACSDLLDAASGKTRHHFQLILDEAIKTGFEDLVVLTPSALPKIKTSVEKTCKRKRTLQQLRLTCLEIQSASCKSQADKLRILNERHASLVGKGFVYITGHSLPTSDLKSFVLDFKKAAKKSSSLAIKVLATKVGSKPDHANGSILAYEKKSNELIGLNIFDRLRGAEFDLTDFCQENQRVPQITETTGEITTKLQVSFDHFVCNAKLLEGLHSNIDFDDVKAYVLDSLAKPVNLDTCQLHMADKLTTTRNSQVQNLRQLKALLSRDSSAASDAIELEGNKSYWVKVGDQSIAHESVELPPNIKLRNAVLMKGAIISKDVESLSDCVVGAGAEVLANCSSCFIAPDTKVQEAVNLCLILPQTLIPAFLPLNTDLYEGLENYGSADTSLRRIRCTSRWFDEQINAEPNFQPLKNDPTADKEIFFDELFDLNEKADNNSIASISSNEQSDDFKDDVIDLLESGEVGHMQDLILELRTLRLSVNKKDADLMRAFGAHVCKMAQQSCGFKSADKISDLLRETELYSIIDAFCSDQDSRVGFYQGVTEFLTTSSALSDDAIQASMFIAVVSSLEEILLNEDHLPVFLSHTQTLKSFHKSPLIEQYLNWLKEDDDSDSGESN